MPRDARAEALAIYDRVVIPKDFDTIEIPFRERGEPVLHHLEDAPRSTEPPAG
jgi:ribonuclease Z